MIASVLFGVARVCFRAVFLLFRLGLYAFFERKFIFLTVNDTYDILSVLKEYKESQKYCADSHDCRYSACGAMYHI